MATNSSLAITFKTVTIQLAVEQVTEAHSNAASGARHLSLHIHVNRAYPHAKVVIEDWSLHCKYTTWFSLK